MCASLMSPYPLSVFTVEEGVAGEQRQAEEGRPTRFHANLVFLPGGLW